jgi:hypothetical protein
MYGICVLVLLNWKTIVYNIHEFLLQPLPVKELRISGIGQIRLFLVGSGADISGRIRRRYFWSHPGSGLYSYSDAYLYNM